MSILDSFDPDKGAILNPERTGGRIEGFPETVVITFQPRLMELVAGWAGAEHLADLSVFYTLPIYRIPYGGRSLGVYQTILGGAASAGLMDEVIARGAKRFVLFGSCGTLDREISAGRLIVPTAAYRDEGVSYHYLPAGDYVDLPTADQTAEILSELGLSHVKGRTWTTDAIYRETRRNMEARRREGCVAVDMECASLAAVAGFRGVELYQYLYGEDNLDALDWEPRTMGSVPRDALEGYLKIALEIAARVDGYGPAS